MSSQYFKYGSGVPVYSTLSAFPTGAANGALAVAADTGNLYEFNITTATWTAIGGPSAVLSLSAFGNTPNADGASLNTGVLTLQPASDTFPGGVSTTAQTFAGVKTFNDGIDVADQLITSVQDPIDDQDAATKYYVDITASGIYTVAAANYATTANLVGVYNNGASGIGATFTLTATGSLVIDGSTVALNDRILIKNQTNTIQNGVYDVTTAGAVGVSAVLTRSTDFDQPDDISGGVLVPVISGTANAGTSWLQVDIVNAIGIDPIEFVIWTANPINYLLKANNLSDVANKTVSLGNLTSYASTVTAAGTTTLTKTSAYYQRFTGTQTQTVVLPDATTLFQGFSFEINNLSTGVVTVQKNGLTTLTTIAPITSLVLKCNSTATAAGSWDVIEQATPLSSVNTLISRDSNGNFQNNNIVLGYFAQNTAASTVTLTASSAAVQIFNGTTSGQIVQLPVVTTMYTGQTYDIVNNSTKNITINSSGGNLVQTMLPGTIATISCVDNSGGTTATNWFVRYQLLKSEIVGAYTIFVLDGGPYATLQAAVDVAPVGSVLLVGANPSGWGDVTISAAAQIDIVGLDGPFSKNVQIGAITFSPASGNILQNTISLANLYLNKTTSTITIGGTAPYRIRASGLYVTGTTGSADTISITNTTATSSFYLDNSIVDANTSTGSAINSSCPFFLSRGNSTFSGGSQAITVTAGIVQLINADIEYAQTAPIVVVGASGTLTANNCLFRNLGTNSTGISNAGTAALDQCTFDISAGTGFLVSGSGTLALCKVLSSNIPFFSPKNTSFQSTLTQVYYTQLPQNYIDGYATTVTATGNTVLSATSPPQQFFTGTNTQTIVMPLTSTLFTGQQYRIVNNSTKLLTVVSSTAATINALPGGSECYYTCIDTAASGAAAWQANSSLLSQRLGFLPGYTSTATATGTTTLTTSSTQDQVFTGSANQTIVMPVTSTLQLGQYWNIFNNSTGLLTVNSSGGNLICTVAGGSSAMIKCILLSGTTAASWLASANENAQANNFISSYTSTVSSAGTLTLTNTSTAQQTITGSTTHTIQMPVANTCVVGQSWSIVNLSTSPVTIQSSGPALIVKLGPNSATVVTCVLASGTGAASWTASAALNIQGNNFVAGYNIITGTGGTTTLTSIDVQQQAVISAGQTIQLPAVSTLNIGTSYYIYNQTLTGIVTVNASGGPGTLVATLPPGSSVVVTSNSIVGTTAASWQSSSSMSMLAQNMVSAYGTPFAGSVTITPTSAQQQVFNGSSAATVTLPTVSQTVQGQSWSILNSGTANLTVQTSGAATAAILPPLGYGVFTVNTTSGTGTSSWNISTAENSIANNMISGQNTFSGATLTMDSTYAQLQIYTGSTASTVTLPDVTKTVLGQTWTIRNSSSSSLLTVQSSGANTIDILGASASATYTVAAITGTGTASWYSSSSTQLQMNSVVPKFQSQNSSGTPFTLTCTSNQVQLYTGTTAATVTLPSGTTLLNGASFTLINESTQDLTVNDGGGTLLCTISSTSVGVITLYSNSTTAGSWIFSRSSPLSSLKVSTTALSSLSIPDTAIIKFPTVTRDNLSQYSTSTGLFTAKVSGYYLIKCNVILSSTALNNVFLALDIVKNGLITSTGLIVSGNATNIWGMFVYDTIIMAVGDTVGIQFRNGNAATYSTTAFSPDNILTIDRIANL